MATLEITWWSGTEFQGGNVPSGYLTSESLTITGASASSAAAPLGAELASIVSVGGAARFALGTTPTAAATSPYISSGERIWLKVRSDGSQQPKIAGITA